AHGRTHHLGGGATGSTVGHSGIGRAGVMRPFGRSGLRLAVVLALTSGARAQAGYTFQTIDVPGAVETDAFGINGAGQIVATYLDSSFLFPACLDTGVSFTTIDVPGARASFPFGINGAGQIVGSYRDDIGGTHGYLDSGGAFTTIDVPVPGTNVTEARGL